MDRLETLITSTKGWKGPISIAFHVPATPSLDNEIIMGKLALWMRKYKSWLDRHVDIHLVIDDFPRQFNYWRNVARLFAQSDFVFLLDVDFAVVTDVEKHILSNPEYLDMLKKGSTAFILPAIEFIGQAENTTFESFPKSKQKVAELWNQGMIESFHGVTNLGMVRNLTARA